MSPLDSMDKTVRFYDDQGIELPDSEKGSFSHVYTARITIARSGVTLPSSVGGGRHHGVTMPGETSAGVGGDPDKIMRLVIVEVTGITDPRFLGGLPLSFDMSEYTHAIATYRTMVVKMGQQFGNS